MHVPMLQRSVIYYNIMWYDKFHTRYSVQRLLCVLSGPFHGLQLTINVQKYENLPFLEQDSGIKASWSFNADNTAVDDHVAWYVVSICLCKDWNSIMIHVFHGKRCFHWSCLWYTHGSTTAVLLWLVYQPTPSEVDCSRCWTLQHASYVRRGSTTVWRHLLYNFTGWRWSNWSSTTRSTCRPLLSRCCQRTSQTHGNVYTLQPSSFRRPVPPPSMTGLSPSPQPGCGTVCRQLSHLHCHWAHLGNALKRNFFPAVICYLPPPSNTKSIRKHSI